MLELKIDSPATLLEGESYTARLTITNRSTKTGVPVEVDLGVGISSIVDGLYLIPEQIASEYFAPNETRTFDYTIVVPSGSGGQSGSITAWIQDPTGKVIVQAAEDVFIEALPPHNDWADYSDTPYTDWDNHADVPIHHDVDHTDWADHSDTPVYHDVDHNDWADHYVTHDDSGVHDDTVYHDVAHLDYPRTDYDAWVYIDDPHGDWADHYVTHDDSGVHDDSVHHDVSHTDWADHYVTHSDSSDYSDWADHYVTHTDWPDAHSDTPHADWSDHVDTP